MKVVLKLAKQGAAKKKPAARKPAVKKKTAKKAAARKTTKAVDAYGFSHATTRVQRLDPAPKQPPKRK